MLHGYFHVSGQSAFLSKGNWHIIEYLLFPDLSAPHIARRLDLEPFVLIQKIIKLTSPGAKYLQPWVGTFPFAFLRAFIYFPKYLFALERQSFSPSLRKIEQQLSSV